MLLAQESADLQKAIELSYSDMKSANDSRGEIASILIVACYSTNSTLPINLPISRH